MLIAVKLFVLPLLEYCSPVWMSAAVRDLFLLDEIACDGRFLFPNIGTVAIMNLTIDT